MKTVRIRRRDGITQRYRIDDKKVIRQGLLQSKIFKRNFKKKKAEQLDNIHFKTKIDVKNRKIHYTVKEEGGKSFFETDDIIV